ncbi:LacI family DNA-binding transcriptional regulator [Altererythrobacter arenosus]|uniref:LacI family DNA-binding transcriptional regulator n=1 Tax=Altererythrobacter arenosus TaxID=3032592 RepID=A0ABY8FU90_9SPHN|nr:LacI family DNA-binding transcriptional regulator [Altererythrobacter sp. CAU 1644]WFL78555.1 LacI family DNA-binding transcriptional regulator [Altererythrobacter sp. CAU 1644]
MARRRQAVTIKHVAADAGVSLQTVSRVINNEPNVRPEMKERVQASIDRLGYVPSIAAQRMSGSRSYLILALNDREKTVAEWRSRSGTDWVDQMLLGGMLTCAEHGYRMMVELVDTHNDHVERELSATIAALQPDGVILTPPHSENRLITDLLASKNIPFARIGSLEPGPGIRLTMDDDHSAVMATERLIELGHKRIGLIAGPKDYSLSGWRIDGWMRAMQAAGFNTDGLCARGDFGFDSGIAAARTLLSQKDRPTAIIASNDQMALATLDVARELDLAVPDKLSLISFDNTPIVRFTNPPLTAVDQPIAATISHAVELLINKSRKAIPADPINIQGVLVERASTAPAPKANGG